MIQHLQLILTLSIFFVMIMMKMMKVMVMVMMIVTSSGCMHFFISFRKFARVNRITDGDLCQPFIKICKPNVSISYIRIHLKN